jgi:hypothetical protein
VLANAACGITRDRPQLAVGDPFPQFLPALLALAENKQHEDKAAAKKDGSGTSNAKPMVSVSIP